MLNNEQQLVYNERVQQAMELSKAISLLNENIDGTNKRISDIKRYDESYGKEYGVQVKMDGYYNISISNSIALYVLEKIRDESIEQRLQLEKEYYSIFPFVINND